MKQPDWYEKRDWREPLPEGRGENLPQEVVENAPRTITNLKLRKVPGENWVTATGEVDGKPFRKTLDGCAELAAMPIDERHHKVHAMLADAEDLQMDDFDKLLDDAQEDEDEEEEEKE